MKKAVLVVFSIALSSVANAQFLVEADGDAAVGVEYDDDYPLQSQFSINTRGNASTLADFNSAGYLTGLSIDRNDSFSQNSNSRIGLKVNSINSQYHENFGIKVTASSANQLGFGKSYGLWSMAGNAQSGYNYAVCASLVSGNYGAAVYGSSGNLPDGFQFTSSLAAYFDGNVQAGGVFMAPAFVTPSDYRLKESISEIAPGSLDNLMEMNVVQYKLKQIEVITDDSTSDKHYKYDPESPVMKNCHYGLIAQELQQLYPELVMEGEDGYLSVNYMEVIPLLISSIQELKNEVDGLRESGKGVTRGTLLSDENVDPVMSAALYQNTPNPFTESTIIECEIPSNIKTALLYIYDMNGRQIDSIGITGRGHTSVTIDGGSLAAGMYLYSLIADGNVIDTRRMILTK